MSKGNWKLASARRFCDCGTAASDRRVDNAFVCERCYQLDIGRRENEKRRRAVVFAGDCNDYFPVRLRGW